MGMLARRTQNLWTRVSKAPGYQALMAGLIAQGAKKLETNAAVVRCRAVDVDVTRAAIAEVQAKNPGSSCASSDPTSTCRRRPRPRRARSCAGGVHVISTDGKIVCNNSLDDRLKVAFERNVPEIRATIFGTNPNIHVKV